MYFNSQQKQKIQTNSNNIESLTLQVDGPITGRAYIWGRERGAYNRNICSVYRLMGI